VAALFLAAFGLGIAFSAPPGMVTALAVQRGLAHGFGAALSVELGSLIGDAAWALVALAGAAYLTQNPIVRVAMGTGGAALLLWLAWRALQSAVGKPRPRATPPALSGSFATGAVISLSNPFAVAFWLGVGGSLISGGDAHPRPAHYVAFFSGFMMAAILWCFFLSALVTWGRRFVTPRFFRWVSLGCGVALSYFAARLLWTALTNATALL